MSELQPASGPIPEISRRAAAASLAAAAAIAGFPGEAMARTGEASDAAAIEVAAGEQAMNPYKFGAEVLHSMNTGPKNQNIICNCVIVLPEGTEVDKAPMHAPRFTIKADHVLMLTRPRLRIQGGSLYAGGWNEHAPWKNQAIDAKHYSWANLSKASKMPGYGIYNFMDYNPDKGREYPFTFPVIKYKNNNLFVTSPSNVATPSDIAGVNFMEKRNLAMQLDGWVEPAKKPVRFIKASSLPPINPNWAYAP